MLRQDERPGLKDKNPVRVGSIEVEEARGDDGSETAAAQHDVVEGTGVGLVRQRGIHTVDRLVECVACVATEEIEAERRILWDLDRDHLRLQSIARRASTSMRRPLAVRSRIRQLVLVPCLIDFVRGH